MNKGKKRTAWVLVFLVILFSALLIDEQPNKEYLELTKVTNVDNSAWLDFQNLASLNINAKESLIKYQEFISILQLSGAEKAKLFLTENEPYLRLDFDISEHCNSTGNKKVEFYDCLDDYVKRMSSIKNELLEHSLILDRINKSEHIFNAKVDTEIINQINSNNGTLLLPDLFRVNHAFDISHELVAVDKLYQILGSEQKSQHCKTKFIDALENRYARVENSNNLIYAIDNLVKTMYLLDVAIYLTNNYPDLNECLNSLKIKKPKGILEGLYESMKQEFVAVTLAFDASAKEIQSELPWYNVFVYKHQKTLNDGSKKHFRTLSNLLEVDSNFFIQKVGIEEPSLLRHWNNISGYIMMKVAGYGHVNLKADFALLSAKFNLVILNARLKDCEKSEDSSCDIILDDFRDPIWGMSPVLNRVEGTLSYIYNDKNKISIPY